MTQVERKNSFSVLAKMPNASADLVGRAIGAKPKPLYSWMKTLTVDDGKEFAYHQSSDHGLGLLTYFANPYCSWHRVSNENFNMVCCANIFLISGAWKLSPMSS